MSDLTAVPTPESLRAWLVDCVADHLGRAPAGIATDVPLTTYGLDSVYALSIAAELEDHLDVSLDPTLIWDHPTIDALSAALVAELRSA
ncbi:hypothetical protein GCM10020358_67320 [Amorphoplanes nipponensis]|uniref:Polyketide synthase n=1 Tax=Actinoplanes nipponensis TaxID=135950 RepID=A0A919MYD0_9ACTN|nr:acyl carrier protein [Actinoplanes nipponensis]GIE54410.1 polyketide synthase [Actinoplanes nipponensis]